MSTPLRKGWCPGALRPMPAKDGLLVRLRISGGILPAAKAHAIADLAERFGSGLFDLSSRGNLQMRGVREAALPHLHDGLIPLGLLDADADGEAVRNVMASPLAGLHEGMDARPLVAALEHRLATDAALHALPAKFGFLIDDGSAPSLRAVPADVRFDWIDGAFAIGLGGTADDAVRIGTCTANELVSRAADIARDAIDLFARHPDRRRMRDLIASPCDAAASSLSPACGKRSPLHQQGSDEGDRLLPPSPRASGNAPHPTPAHAGATFSCKREKTSARQVVGPRTFGAVSCLGLAAPFGRLDATMLRAVASIADATPLGELRLTPWRAILVPGVSARTVPGFIDDTADPRLRVAACVGADGCERGTTPTHAHAARLTRELDGAAADDILLHVSGCEKGCAKASPSPVTLVARDGRYDLVRDGRAGDIPCQRGLDIAEAHALLASALEPA